MRCIQNRPSLAGYCPLCVQASLPFSKSWDWMQSLYVTVASHGVVLQVSLRLAFSMQLLSFFKTSFYFFGICTALAAVALVPINYRENGTSEGVPPPAPDPDDSSLLFDMLMKSSKDTYHGSTLYLTSRKLLLLTSIGSCLRHPFADLIFTYIFSLLALFMLYRAYRAFIHTVS